VRDLHAEAGRGNEALPKVVRPFGSGLRGRGGRARRCPQGRYRGGRPRRRRRLSDVL